MAETTIGTFSDDFAYPTGDLNGNGAWGTDGFSVSMKVDPNGATASLTDDTGSQATMDGVDCSLDYTVTLHVQVSPTAADPTNLQQMLVQLAGPGGELNISLDSGDFGGNPNQVRVEFDATFLTAPNDFTDGLDHELVLTKTAGGVTLTIDGSPAASTINTPAESGNRIRLQATQLTTGRQEWLRSINVSN